MRREWGVVFALTVWGCGAPADKPGAKPSCPIRRRRHRRVPEAVLSAADAASPVGFRLPWKGDLDGMIERRFIRVLVDALADHLLHRQGSRSADFEALQPFETQLNLGWTSVKRVR